MFQVHKIDDWIVVTGYPDGSDWIFEAARSFGTIGSDRSRLWMLTDEAVIQLFDLAGRRLLREIDCGPTPVAGSTLRADGERNRLYLLRPPSGSGREADAELTVIDLDSGAAIHRRPGLSWFKHDGFEIMADGALLLPAIVPGEGGPVDLLTRIDPEDFSVTQSSVSRPTIPGTMSFGWVGNSPGGQWWLRPDHTHFPMVERSAHPGAASRTYYGLTLQIWSAFPLRYVGRVVAAWLKAEDLPDATGINRPRAIRHGRGPEAAAAADAARRAEVLQSVPARDLVWQQVAAALTRPGADPDAPFPPREEFGPAAADDVLWRAITENLKELMGHPFSRPLWQDDCEAAWLDRRGFRICVGMDGTASPRLWTERFGLVEGMAAPGAHGPPTLRVLPGRKLIAGSWPSPGFGRKVPPNEGGAMMFDGSPRADALEPVMIPMAADGWRAGAGGLPPRQFDETAYRARIRGLQKIRGQIRVPLPSLAAADREAAIGRLTATIDGDLGKRADHFYIDIGFELDGRTIAEKPFFEMIAPSDRDWAVPALRSLIERFVECVPAGGQTLYQPNDEGLLGTAVLRLGQLDHASLPLIRRYGERMDRGHEYHFPGTVLPAIIRAHGWTGPVIHFGLWVMMFNFYNTYDRPETIWRDFGLAAALQTRHPEDVAQCLVADFRGEIGARVFGVSPLGALCAALDGRMSAWEEHFFDTLKALVPGSTSD